MQALQTRNTTQAINHTQSMAAVQTLLRAGLGAIAFLRNLLPEDNFATSHFTAIDGSSSQSFDINSSQESIDTRRNVNGFKVMTLTRGYTDEADRILNYLVYAHLSAEIAGLTQQKEYGIFDALEKRYLRSFIFAIYLDSKDPTNIVEAYTFNFKYHTIPGTDVTVPVMSLDDELQKLSLNKKRNQEDPVTKAVKAGKLPTIKDVKASVKAMLKQLCHAMHQMDSLPKRRFATFKVFYTDETPLDYEPPHFHAGDVDRDKWYFMTHDFNEVPEKISIGKVDTGHHSVNLSVTSIVSYLPSSTEHDDAAFGGTTNHPARLSLTPLQEATISRQQAEQQLEDAEKRNLAWKGEDSVEQLSDDDAEGEEDLGYTPRADGIYMPVGIRGDEGTIKPLPAGETLDEAQYAGVSMHVPTRLQEMAAEKDVNHDFEETQPLLLTPKNLGPRRLSSPSSNDQQMLSPLSNVQSELSTRATSFDADMLKAMSVEPVESGDTEMLDLETQLPQELSNMDSIESFGPLSALERIEPPSPARTYATHTSEDNGLECECEVTIDEDQSFYCEGGCKKWFHVWCMGYHSVMDPRAPRTFICFDCRVRSDVKWELIKLDLYPQMISKFKDLTLFRRAIKVAEKIKAFTPVEFHKAFGCDARLGGQMIKRLEDEELILKEETTLDDMGLTTTAFSKSTKGKGKGKAKQVKPRKNMQKARFAFNLAMQSTPQYLDYFKPNDQAIENRLLGISEMTMLPIAKLTKLPLPPVEIEETQTQEETQLMLTPKAKRTPVLEVGAKRTVQQAELDSHGADRPLKKVKISVVEGIDLAE